MAIPLTYVDTAYLLTYTQITDFSETLWRAVRNSALDLLRARECYSGRAIIFKRRGLLPEMREGRSFELLRAGVATAPKAGTAQLARLSGDWVRGLKDGRDGDDGLDRRIIG